VVAVVVVVVATGPEVDPTTTLLERPVLHTVHTDKAKAAVTVLAVVAEEEASLVEQVAPPTVATTAHILEKTAIV
jgi:hypothetical protein